MRHIWNNIRMSSRIYTHFDLGNMYCAWVVFTYALNKIRKVLQPNHSPIYLLGIRISKPLKRHASNIKTLYSSFHKQQCRHQNIHTTYKHTSRLEASGTQTHTALRLAPLCHPETWHLGSPPDDGTPWQSQFVVCTSVAPPYFPHGMLSAFAGKNKSKTFIQLFRVSSLKCDWYPVFFVFAFIDATNCGMRQTHAFCWA